MVLGVGGAGHHLQVLGPQRGGQLDGLALVDVDDEVTTTRASAPARSAAAAHCLGEVGRPSATWYDGDRLAIGPATRTGERTECHAGIEM